MEDRVSTLASTVFTFACSVVRVVWHGVIERMEDAMGDPALSKCF